MGQAVILPRTTRMDGRNGKWVNVDYTNRILDESIVLANGAAHASTRATVPAVVAPLHAAPSSPSSSSIQVIVSEPVKQGEGMNAYISYKISTTTTRPQFAKSTFAVVRRYSDFVWIHSHLNALYPGVVVPPLPEKLLVGRFSPEFIESRRRALQLFLHRCCLHPELQHCHHLSTFLEASDDELQRFRKDPRHAAPNAQRGALFQWLDDTVTTISSTLIPVASNLPKSAADQQVDEMMAYIDGLEPIMTGLHKHAHGLTKRAREIADGLFEFGVALTLLGKSEANVSLQEGLNHIGHCSDQLSLLAAEHAEQEALHFEEPIFDYIRLVGAVKAALQKRNEVRGAYGAAVAALEAKEASLAKLQKHARGGSEEKVQGAETDVRVARELMEEAQIQDDIVTERVLREVERFQRTKRADFKHIILDYIQMQIQYSQKVEKAWQNVLPQLAQIQVEAVATISEATDLLTNDEATAALDESLADLTLMTSDATLYQRSPYGTHSLADSNPDVSL